MAVYRMNTMLKRTVAASDGEVGSVYDLYFTDDTWQVKYLILRTGSFFSGRRLMMDPGLVQDRGKAGEGVISVEASRAEILASPDYMADPPVNEQKMKELYPRFLWPPSGDLHKVVWRPLGAAPHDLEVHEDEVRARGENPHLQSFREVRGYAVYCQSQLEKLVGHVADFISSSQDWRVTHVTVDIGQEKPLLVDVSDIASIDWAGANLYLLLQPEDLPLLAMDDPVKYPAGQPAGAR